MCAPPICIGRPPALDAETEPEPELEKEEPDAPIVCGASDPVRPDMLEAANGCGAEEAPAPAAEDAAMDGDRLETPPLLGRGSIVAVVALIEFECSAPPPPKKLAAATDALREWREPPMPFGPNPVSAPVSEEDSWYGLDASWRRRSGG